MFENERIGTNGSILVKGMQETYIGCASDGIRLLQMGSQKRSFGRTDETCIIATVSPYDSSLEETASPLDYVSRAKNIRNKPHINTPVPRDKLLSELVTEIEKLKSNLTAPRHRNGIYMGPDTYEAMMKDNSSSQIINSEQKERIEIPESAPQHKAEELLTLAGQLQSLKSDNEKAHSKPDWTNDALNKAQHTQPGSVIEVTDVTEK
ncbi:kinesin motor protein cin8 [Aspergillus hancockii]|nr:kinesin motor protein cin8 [Aspergillus hancockii]